jgi:transposase-like protein
MDEISAPQSPRRRRHSPELKSRVIAACQEPGVSVSRVALDHGLNANMVRTWIKAANAQPSSQSTSFVPLALPAPRPTPPKVAEGTIRIEVPRSEGMVTITWPVDHADRAVALLRELLL